MYGEVIFDDGAYNYRLKSDFIYSTVNYQSDIHRPTDVMARLHFHGSFNRLHQYFATGRPRAKVGQKIQQQITSLFIPITFKYNVVYFIRHR